MYLIGQSFSHGGLYYVLKPMWYHGPICEIGAGTGHHFVRGKSWVLQRSTSCVKIDNEIDSPVR